MECNVVEWNVSKYAWMCQHLITSFQVLACRCVVETLFQVTSGDEGFHFPEEGCSSDLSASQCVPVINMSLPFSFWAR